MSKNELSKKKKNKIKINLRLSWKAFNQNRKFSYKTPNESLVQMVSPFLKNVNTFIDLGSGSQNNSLWLAENKKKVFSIDYAQKNNIYKNKKNIIFKNIDLTNSEEIKFIQQYKIDFVIMHQFIDHLFLEDAFDILKFLNKNIHIEYIYISFLKTKSFGSQVVGKKLTKTSYMSPISKRLGAKFKELHTFYSDKNIKKSLKILNNFSVTNKKEVAEKYFEKNKNVKNFEVTDHYLLKKIKKPNYCR
jgi:hypothetical protein